MSFVADTHVLVWWTSEPTRLTARIAEVLATVSAESPLFVPDICLWEIATLVSLGRLRPSIPLRDWLARATALPLVQIVANSPEIAAEVAPLPETFLTGTRAIASSYRPRGCSESRC